MKSNKVIILKGGISSEREVSLRTGAAVSIAMSELGYEVVEIDVTEKSFILPDEDTPIFICLHGAFGEDGELQERLTAEGRRFTGSGAVACRAAFDKMLARHHFSEAGLRVAQGGEWSPDIQCQVPFVLKPIADGSSVGVHLVLDESNRVTAEAAAKSAIQSGGRYMFESYVKGREVTAGVLDGKSLPLIEIRPRDGFYDYEHKYVSGKADHVCPAPLEPDVAEQVSKAALRAHHALGCEVYSRVDFIIPESGEPVVLEVNTIPGMTELSLLPEAAAAAGISFPELCKIILERSLEVAR